MEEYRMFLIGAFIAASFLIASGRVIIHFALGDGKEVDKFLAEEIESKTADLGFSLMIVGSALTIMFAIMTVIALFTGIV